MTARDSQASASSTCLPAVGAHKLRFAENAALHRLSEGIGVDTLGDEKLGVKGENSEEVSVILALWRTRTAVSKKVPAVGSTNPETTNVLGP